MNKSIEINYRDNDALRASFNELAGKVFGLSFENWYQNGFWKDNYIPYSVVIDGKVVANVSVNRCDVSYNGETKSLIQLGTVMTDPDHRGKGYARELMEKIIFDYEIRDTKTGEVVATGHSVQVFMDAKSHQLVLTSPDFYEEWKQRWGVNR